MRNSDVYVFANRAWLVVGLVDQGTRVKLRLMAGPGDEPKTTTVLLSMLEGRSVYRAVPVLEDVDLQNAIEEATGEIDTELLAANPRSWTEEFHKLHGGHVTPDRTLMLGWFARAIDAGRRSAQIPKTARKPVKPKTSRVLPGKTKRLTKPTSR